MSLPDLFVSTAILDNARSLDNKEVIHQLLLQLAVDGLLEEASVPSVLDGVMRLEISIENEPRGQEDRRRILTHLFEWLAILLIFSRRLAPPCAKTLLRRNQDWNGSVYCFTSVRSIDFLDA